MLLSDSQGREQSIHKVWRLLKSGSSLASRFQDEQSESEDILPSFDKWCEDYFKSGNNESYDEILAKTPNSNLQLEIIDKVETTLSAEKLHNDILLEFAEELSRNLLPSEAIRTNTNENKRNSVITGNCEYYPDIYIFDKTSDSVKAIYEVETSKTMNEDSAEKWKLCVSGIARFYLVIPAESLAVAKKIVGKLQINVQGYYTY